MVNSELSKYFMPKSPVHVNSGAFMQALIEKRLTQNELSKTAGLCETTISNMKHGKPCHVSSVIKVCNALDLELYELLKE